MITKLKNVLAGLVLVVMSSTASAAIIKFKPSSDLDYTNDTPVLVNANNGFDSIGTVATELTVVQDLTTTIWDFTYDDNNGEKLKVSLFDTLGSLVFASDEVISGPLSFTINNLLAGTYLLQIDSSSKDVNGQISAVPVPAAALLFGTALLGFAGFSARRKV